MLTIGSKALAIYADIGRRPRDTDVMGEYDECINYIKSQPGELRRCVPSTGGKKVIAFKGGNIIEAEIAWEDSSAKEFIEIMAARGHYAYPDINGLYALKMSHRYLKNSPAFLKTMRDIKLLRELGAEIDQGLTDWFKRRESETYSYSHPSLKQSKKDFFQDDGILYKYDHDTIHLAVKHQERPAYDYFKPDTSEVFFSREMFWEIDQEIRLNAVLEESYVLALERSQIPHGERISPRRSFEIALMKVCTSITSGWFREFAWENYDEVVARYSDDYVDRLNAGVKSGLVKEAV